MNSEHWRTRALIDCGALRHNLSVVRKLAPNCRVMAVVKANGYGHGMATVCAAIAKRVDAFAVASVEEGIECRAADLSLSASLSAPLPVVVLSGLQRPASLALCSRYCLSPVVHSMEQVEWIERHDDEPLNLWLKIDTGMNRLGIAPDEVAAVVSRLRRSKYVTAIRLMSHLANADDPQDDLALQQLRRFQQCTDQYASQSASQSAGQSASQFDGQSKLERSLANSAGIMHWQQTHMDWVRPGIMLYGGSPLIGSTASHLNLRPVMRLEARLLAIKEVAAGQPVGYGGTFITPTRMRIGIIGFGYGDGYPRVLSDAAEVLIGDVRAAVIGKVAMNMITIDLNRCPEAAVGQAVVLWGGSLGVDEVAGWAGTNAHEILCKVSERVARVSVT